MKRITAIRRLVSSFLALPVLGLKACELPAQEPTMADVGKRLIDSALDPYNHLWPNEAPFPCRFSKVVNHVSRHTNGPWTNDSPNRGDCSACRLAHNRLIISTDPEWYEDIVVDRSTGFWEYIYCPTCHGLIHPLPDELGCDCSTCTFEDKCSGECDICHPEEDLCECCGEPECDCGFDGTTCLECQGIGHSGPTNQQ